MAACFARKDHHTVLTNYTKVRARSPQRPSSCWDAAVRRGLTPANRAKEGRKIRNEITCYALDEGFTSENAMKVPRAEHDARHSRRQFSTALSYDSSICCSIYYSSIYVECTVDFAQLTPAVLYSRTQGYPEPGFLQHVVITDIDER